MGLQAGASVAGTTRLTIQGAGVETGLGLYNHAPAALTTMVIAVAVDGGATAAADDGFTMTIEPIIQETGSATFTAADIGVVVA